MKPASKSTLRTLAEKNLRRLTYPRITTDKPGQCPFNQPFYLLIDIQLGGKWVGAIDKTLLPFQMEVD